MPTVHLVRHTPAPPCAVWDVLTDFGAHGRWMPLTTMRLEPGRPRLGWSFAGLTGVGPLRFSDPMVVTGWSPPSGERPGELRLVKTGRLLGGWIQVTVAGHGQGSRLVWHEELTIRPLPAKRLTGPVVGLAATWLYARAIDGMLGQAMRVTTSGAGAR
jgi:uncharacterized protein YndB with AHSA1/START domain